LRNKANKYFVCNSHDKLALQKHGAHRIFKSQWLSCELPRKPRCSEGGPGERHLRNGAFKDNAVMGKSVQGRRFDVDAAIATEVVGPHGINRDEQNIGFWFVGWRDSRQGV
jgi:hypothetical protein